MHHRQYGRSVETQPREGRDQGQNYETHARRPGSYPGPIGLGDDLRAEVPFQMRRVRAQIERAVLGQRPGCIRRRDAIDLTMRPAVEVVDGQTAQKESDGAESVAARRVWARKAGIHVRFHGTASRESIVGAREFAN